MSRNQLICKHIFCQLFQLQTLLIWHSSWAPPHMSKSNKLQIYTIFLLVNLSTSQHVNKSTCQQVNISTCQHVSYPYLREKYKNVGLFGRQKSTSPKRSKLKSRDILWTEGVHYKFQIIWPKNGEIQIRGLLSFYIISDVYYHLPLKDTEASVNLINPHITTCQPKTHRPPTNSYDLI